MDKKTIIMLTLSIIPFIHCYSQTKEIEGCYIIRYEKNEIWHDPNIIPIDYTEVREFIPYFKCEGIPEILEGQITTYLESNDYTIKIGLFDYIPWGLISNVLSRENRDKMRRELYRVESPYLNFQDCSPYLYQIIKIRGEFIRIQVDQIEEPLKQLIMADLFDWHDEAKVIYVLQRIISIDPVLNIRE